MNFLVGALCWCVLRQLIMQNEIARTLALNVDRLLRLLLSMLDNPTEWVLAYTQRCPWHNICEYQDPHVITEYILQFHHCHRTSLNGNQRLCQTWSDVVTTFLSALCDIIFLKLMGCLLLSWIPFLFLRNAATYTKVWKHRVMTV